MRAQAWQRPGLCRQAPKRRAWPNTRPSTRRAPAVRSRRGAACVSGVDPEDLRLPAAPTDRRRCPRARPKAASPQRWRRTATRRLPRLPGPLLNAQSSFGIGALESHAESAQTYWLAPPADRRSSANDRRLPRRGAAEVQPRRVRQLSRFSGSHCPAARDGLGVLRDPDLRGMRHVESYIKPCNTGARATTTRPERPSEMRFRTWISVGPTPHSPGSSAPVAR